MFGDLDKLSEPRKVNTRVHSPCRSSNGSDALLGWVDSLQVPKLHPLRCFAKHPLSLTRIKSSNFGGHVNFQSIFEKPEKNPKKPLRNLGLHSRNLERGLSLPRNNMAFRAALSLRSKVAFALYGVLLTCSIKVCVVGGAGGIGQPLSLLLKQNSLVSHVSVFDLVGAPG